MQIVVMAGHRGQQLVTVTGTFNRPNPLWDEPDPKKIILTVNDWEVAKKLQNVADTYGGKAPVNWHPVDGYAAVTVQTQCLRRALHPNAQIIARTQWDQPIWTATLAIKPYTIISKFEMNYGETVKGFSFILKELKRQE